MRAIVGHHGMGVGDLCMFARCQHPGWENGDGRLYLGQTAAGGYYHDVVIDRETHFIYLGRHEDWDMFFVGDKIVETGRVLLHRLVVLSSANLTESEEEK